MGGAVLYLATRLGFGKVDFRREACCIVMGWVVVLQWVGATCLYFTTRLGIGSVDFRGEVCCIVIGWVVVL